LFKKITLVTYKHLFEAIANFVSPEASQINVRKITFDFSHGGEKRTLPLGEHAKYPVW